MEAKNEHMKEIAVNTGGFIVPPGDAEKLQDYVRAIENGDVVGGLPLRPISIIIPDSERD